MATRGSRGRFHGLRPRYPNPDYRGRPEIRTAWGDGLRAGRFGEEVLVHAGLMSQDRRFGKEMGREDLYPPPPSVEIQWPPK